MPLRMSVLCVQAGPDRPAASSWSHTEISSRRLDRVTQHRCAEPGAAVADLFKTASLGLGSFAAMDTPTSESRHLSVHIDRSAQHVYDYASDPSHLPEWALGLGSSIELIDGEWIVEAPTGRIVVTFAPRNEFGVLDHQVTLASGETFYNPIRVTTDGAG